MKKKLESRKFLLLIICVLLIPLGMSRMYDRAELSRLHGGTHISPAFRNHILNEDAIAYLQKTEDAGETAGLWLLASDFGYGDASNLREPETFKKLYEKWAGKNSFQKYLNVCRAIWNDVAYFPVPESETDKSLTVAYTDSWMNERSFGGKRGHEGTDIMAQKDKPGVYPVLSMSDGVVTSIGWLEKGGWRIGITAPKGAYFYYAHLSSYANLKEGDRVKAGDFLGYMGDSGYGKEGTTGMFPTHLHLGIYIYEEQKEVSINPYWILKYAEKHKLKYAFS